MKNAQFGYACTHTRADTENEERERKEKYTSTQTKEKEDAEREMSRLTELLNKDREHSTFTVRNKNMFITRRAGEREKEKE
jgi:hypothetical protein